MRFDCDKSKIKAYALTLESIPEKDIDVLLVKTDDYKCGSNFIVKHNTVAGIVLILSEGKLSIDYTIGKVAAGTTPTSDGLGLMTIIGIIVGLVALLGVGIGIYIYRKRKLQQDLDEQNALIH